MTNIHAHVLTDQYLPVKGGLEKWTRDFVTHLSNSEITVGVYVLGTQLEANKEPTQAGFYLVEPTRSALIAPMKATFAAQDKLSKEHDRLTFLITRNVLLAELNSANNSARHIIISTFALTSGYLGFLLSKELSIPHLVVLAGTDFSRGFRNSRERHVLTEVCQSASRVICRSHEQFAGVLDICANVPLSVILTSVAQRPVRWSPRKDKNGCIAIFSDAGLSYHKGTLILIEACRIVSKSGLPVSLTICGQIEKTKSKFWETQLRKVRAQSGLRIEVLGYVSTTEIASRLLDADIYASATLGEGCSSARVAALCMGLPIVTTACGEFASTELRGSHVKIAEVASLESFACKLSEMCNESRTQTILIDEDLVNRALGLFAPAREWAAWDAIMHGYDL